MAVAVVEQTWRAPFLNALRNSGNVRAACAAVGVSRQYVYAQRVADSEFNAEWDEALKDAVDVLDAEARRRGMGGSDTLLIYMLKVHGDERYRDANRTTDAQPATSQTLVLNGLSSEQLDAAIAKLAGGRA